MSKSLPEVRLRQSIEEAFIHIKRLMYAGNKINSYFPLTEEFMLNIEDEKVEHFDQFVYRFMKLQDCIGLRLFSSLLDYLQEDHRTKPFLDILNRLEQLGIIESAYFWQELRDIRNNLTHEYPDNIKENISSLNMLYKKTADLIREFKSIINYINRTTVLNIQQPDNYE